MLKGNRLYTCINHYAGTLSLSLNLFIDKFDEHFIS